jgi:sulfide:quinone oxidoreductase
MTRATDRTILSERQTARGRPQVIIAGGGVAALEALVALRDLLDGFVGIDLVAPNEDFVYRPLSVAEPFGLAEPRHFALRKVASEHSAALRQGKLEAVSHDQATVRVTDGSSLSYDALLVAIGARTRQWLEGAVHFAGPEDVGRMRRLVADLDRGAVASIVFVAPPRLSWTLPLYELALLTAAHVGGRGRGDVRLTVVTPETSALEVFGPAAAQHVRDLCADRGIRLRTATRVVSFQKGSLKLDRGDDVEADEVVALPELEGEVIEGLPHDDAGFIPVDEHGAVRGMPGVYAAGDGIDYPIKQGGLATQQADAAAEAIAADLGAAVEPRPFRPRLRGQLLTGLGLSYLTAAATEAGPSESSVAANPLWWPPSKIAGRYLAPYLASHVSHGGPEQLRDRPPVAPVNPAGANAHHDEMRRLALTFAESDAAGGDYASALRWLDTVEQLEGLRSPAVAQKRAEWQKRRGTN